jgi:hypothetical protein
MNIAQTYYLIKPLIPRRAQIAIRRLIASHKRKRTSTIWPILPSAGRSPEGWKGWPDQKRFALILCHDVDTEKGHSRCIELMNIEEELGFRSSFNFVPEDYRVSQGLRERLIKAGFEVGVHGLKHDGKLFGSREIFDLRAPKIDSYLKDWGAVGFYSPAMYRNVDWIAELSIEYACSTFDTDPFEPQPNDVGTIFPLWIWNKERARGYVELPYTLPQDHCLFAILKEKDIKIWVNKFDWIATQGGMARINTHPDYMNFNGTRCSLEEYPVSYYKSFLEHIKNNFKGQYWHVLPRDLARFWKRSIIGGPAI